MRFQPGQRPLQLRLAAGKAGALEDVLAIRLRGVTIAGSFKRRIIVTLPARHQVGKTEPAVGPLFAKQFRDDGIAAGRLEQSRYFG